MGRERARLYLECGDLRGLFPSELVRVEFEELAFLVLFAKSGREQVRWEKALASPRIPYSDLHLNTKRPRFRMNRTSTRLIPTATCLIYSSNYLLQRVRGRVELPSA